MRWAVVIIGLAAVAAGLVQIRRSEIRQRYEMRQLALDQIQLRRDLYDQQMQLSEMTSPQTVRAAVEVKALDLADRTSKSWRESVSLARSSRLP